jgi:hypothetical protein
MRAAEDLNVALQADPEHVRKPPLAGVNYLLLLSIQYWVLHHDQK